MSLRHDGPLHDGDPWGRGPVRSRCFCHGERVFAHLGSMTLGLVTYHYIHLYSKNRRCRLAKRKKDQQTGLLGVADGTIARHQNACRKMSLYGLSGFNSTRALLASFPPSIGERKAFAIDSNQPESPPFEELIAARSPATTRGAAGCPKVAMILSTLLSTLCRQLCLHVDNFVYTFCLHIDKIVYFVYAKFLPNSRCFSTISKQDSNSSNSVKTRMLQGSSYGRAVALLLARWPILKNGATPTVDTCIESSQSQRPTHKVIPTNSIRHICFYSKNFLYMLE